MPLGRAVQEAPSAGVRRWVARGLLLLRWERDDGSVCCRLVTGKTQVTPKMKITIPRMELMVVISSVRLARKVKEALKIPLAGTRYFTDFSAVSRMLRTESRKFTEFVGAKVSKVKVNSNVEKNGYGSWETAILRTLGHGQSLLLRTWPPDWSIRKEWHG